jgi:protease-4
VINFFRSLTAGRGALAAFVIVVAAVGGPLPGVARAQTSADVPDAAFRPTRGVYVPEARRAGDGDATAVELNPGQLSLLGHTDVTAIVDAWRARAALPGRGVALFAATPLGQAAGLGLGLQRVFAGDAADFAGYTKLQLGLGLGGRNFGVGATWGHLFGDGVGGTNSLDVGASARFLGHAALGLVIEDAARPRLPGATGSLPRRWVGELALRPTGTDRVEVAAAALHLGDEAWSRIGSRFRASVRAGGGWRLFGELELAPRRPLPGLAADGTDRRLTFGFAADFDHASLALAAREAFVPTSEPGGGWGGALVVHHTVQRNVPSVDPIKVVRFELHHLESDRAFVEVALRLRALATEPNVAAVLLVVDELELGTGRIEELRDLVGELRRHGKRVVAYLTYPSTRDMYLASACDRIVLHPAGVVELVGLAQAVTFYKAAMDRLGVSLELIRIAEFKGAMEPFVMTSQSEPVRRNRNELLDDVYDRILAAIASGRAGEPASEAKVAAKAPLVGVAPAQLVEKGTFTPEEARRAGLIDAVRDDDEVKDYLREYLGAPRIAVERRADPAPVRPMRWPGARTAVILVEGTIVDGPNQEFPLGGGGLAGADTLVDALDECRRDPTVRAVVLRVNSPGGSAFSSDVIARAVARVRASGRPVVVSMGDVAASGGYYIAAPADAIFAEPSTTTGSIGIFGYKLDVSGLLAKLSLTTEVTTRGAHADALLPFRSWTPEERAAAEQKIRHLYEMFLATVATGRQRNGLTAARVDELGRGHVYTGAQAKALGLVDEMGGLTAALDRAMALGGLSRGEGEIPELLILPRPSGSLLKRIASFASVEDETKTSDGLAPPLRPLVRLLAPYLFGPGEGIEARLPFDLETR